jgi:uncharacterized membrane protein
MEFQSIVVGSIAIMVLILIPGIALSLALFPKKDQLEFVERAGFSFALGLVPQALQYFLDKNFNVPITTATTYGLIAGVTVAGLAVWAIRK